MRFIYRWLARRLEAAEDQLAIARRRLLKKAAEWDARLAPWTGWPVGDPRAPVGNSSSRVINDPRDPQVGNSRVIDDLAAAFADGVEKARIARYGSIPRRSLALGLPVRIGDVWAEIRDPDREFRVAEISPIDVTVVAFDGSSRLTMFPPDFEGWTFVRRAPADGPCQDGDACPDARCHGAIHPGGYEYVADTSAAQAMEAPRIPKDLEMAARLAFDSFGAKKP